VCEQRIQHYASETLKETHHAIILSFEGRHFTTQFLRRGPRLCQYLVNYLRDSVRTRVDGPRHVGHGIVLNDVSQMAAVEQTNTVIVISVVLDGKAR
jgi:hypothetical protein